MGRKFDRHKDWTKYPLRQAIRRVYDCGLCPLKISVGHRYYDCGNGVRVHKTCGDLNAKEEKRDG